MGSKNRVSSRLFFSLFVEWVLHTLTLKYLSEKNKISVSTLSTRFQPFLAHLPSAKKYFLNFVAQQYNTEEFSGFLIIDGDWFGNRVLVVYKDSKAGIVFWRFSKGEYKQEIKNDITFLKEHGYPLKGTVSDGKNALINAGKEHKVPVQRCLVHIQKGINRSLTRKPKSIAGKQLKEWSMSLNRITNKYEARVLLLWFIRLYKRHENFIKERTYSTDYETDKKTWWYTHQDTRKAYRLVVNGYSNMFTYLRFKNMPKDTNGLEGYFSQLNNKISRHRGLNQTSKEHLILWFLYLSCFPKTTMKKM